VKNGDRPFEADEIRFQEVVDDLVAIKRKLKQDGVETSGIPLGVHAGFSAPHVEMVDLLREFLTNHLRSDRMNAIAFMGIQSAAEPWVFFAATRRPQTNQFQLVDAHPSLQGANAQVLSFVTQSIVFPKPTNRQFGVSRGVATDVLFPITNVDKPLFAEETSSPLKDITVRHAADIVANPEISHFFTTDCVSCHTESSLRESELNGESTSFAYVLPPGISGVDPEVLPKESDRFRNWNVRNFGWGFQTFQSNMVPTVTTRTANESAESADFINQHYLSSSVSKEEPPAESGSQRSSHTVASPLTLMMKCPDESTYADLKRKIKALLDQDDNPINKALDEIGTVHFARFVFFDETKQVAVITTYDGDFEAYIHRFAAKIGDVFNLILEHVEGVDAMRNADGRIRVQDHLPEFLQFVSERDFEGEQPFYSAYPDLTVQQIRRLKGEALQSSE
ncbi:hypothetical protein GYB59_02850, partial [bacterium]|nr:hypothetical protein [bacterium]